MIPEDEFVQICPATIRLMEKADELKEDLESSSGAAKHIKILSIGFLMLLSSTTFCGELGRSTVKKLAKIPTIGS